MPIQVDAATGSGWEELGRAIRAAGQEDSSGMRRYCLHLLVDDDLLTITRTLRINMHEARRLRSLFL